MSQDLQRAERDAITGPLLEEFRTLFLKWNAEYGNVERDLGVRASFCELWRKAKKIRAAIWEDADTTGWRETPRTILLEIIGHAFLMLFDLDRAAREAADADPR